MVNECLRHQEIQEAITPYKLTSSYRTGKVILNDLLHRHHTLMIGLITEVGQYRQGGGGVMSGEQVIHITTCISSTGNGMIYYIGLKHSPDHH